MTEYHKGIHPCNEYATVKRNVDMDRLRRLHNTRLNQEQATELVAALAKRMKGLTAPGFRFTARTDRAYYIPWTEEIQIRPRHISTHHLLHELAHHWNTLNSRRLRRKLVDHGLDFADCLDRLAQAAEEELVTLLGCEPLTETTSS